MKNCLFIFLIVLTSCKSYDYSIIETKIEDGKSKESFISGAIISATDFKDTLIHYHLNLLSDSLIFKEKSQVNIGISIYCLHQDSAYSIKLGFKSMTRTMQTDTSVNLKSGNYYFTNNASDNSGKSFESSFSFIDDRYQTPFTATILTSEEKMKEFLNLFKEELFSDTDKNDTLLFTSSSHLDGYFKNINLTIARR